LPSSMTDSSAEEKLATEQMAKGAETEKEILCEPESRSKAAEKAQEESAQTKTLPQLSAAEYRVYNSMAEHMEYFVGSLP
jgi:hypothetical protein